MQNFRKTCNLNFSALLFLVFCIINIVCSNTVIHVLARLFYKETLFLLFTSYSQLPNSTSYSNISPSGLLEPQTDKGRAKSKERLSRLRAVVLLPLMSCTKSDGKIMRFRRSLDLSRARFVLQTFNRGRQSLES